MYDPLMGTRRDAYVLNHACLGKSQITAVQKYARLTRSSPEHLFLIIRVVRNCIFNLTHLPKLASLRGYYAPGLRR